jgi:hypothetical protein
MISSALIYIYLLDLVPQRAGYVPGLIMNNSTIKHSFDEQLGP